MKWCIVKALFCFSPILGVDEHPPPSPRRALLTSWVSSPESCLVARWRSRPLSIFLLGRLVSSDLCVYCIVTTEMRYKHSLVLFKNVLQFCISHIGLYSIWNLFLCLR